MRDALRFVAVCCRWPQDQASRGAVVEAAAGVEDWTEVQAEAEHHRVVPLVEAATRDIDGIPADFRTWIKAKAQSNALRAMQMSGDCLKLDRALKAKGISVVHFKGPVLGQMAYGSVALKTSRDLDIFLPADQAPAAFDVLAQIGYRPMIPGGTMTEALARALVRNFKDVSFLGPNGTLVELHWRLSRINGNPRAAEDKANWQTVRLANAGDLFTLSAADLVPYLCMHGAEHHWMRLKWLADLSAYMAQIPVEFRDQLLSDPKAGPQRDTIDQALALCDRYFGTQYDPTLSARAKALYDYSVAEIDQPQVPTPGFVAREVAIVRDIAAKRHLYPSPLAAIWSLRKHLIVVDDVLAWPLPGYLNWLYIVIRVPSMVIRRLKRIRARDTRAA